MPLTLGTFPLAFCALLILSSDVGAAKTQHHFLHTGLSATSAHTSESQDASVTVVPGSQGQVIIVDEDGDGEGVVLVLGEAASIAPDQRPVYSVPTAISTTPTTTPPLPMADIEVNPATGHSFIRTGDRAPQLVNPRTGKPFDSSTIPSAQPSFVSGQLQPPANFPSTPDPTAPPGTIGFVLPPPIAGAAVPSLTPDTAAQTEASDPRAALSPTPTESEAGGNDGEELELNAGTGFAQAPADEPADATSMLSDSG
ncbi:hypothetical protein BSKO_13729 [Bryopsis sp. KO-2023]|nr:hypothetical protein BSKO_13729 [Bryopsis sp. KO-2023]